MANPQFSDGQRGEEETALIKRGVGLVAGVDEAGRGPLAGPVVAAAVIFYDALPEGIDDSKKLSAKKRETVYSQILKTAHVGVALASPAEIDAFNIRGATLRAMVRAVAALPVPADHVLVDGRDAPDFGVPATALIGGDRRSVSIAAASIIAKVVRDSIMLDLDGQFPVYGFAGHKGYPTQAHRDALLKNGVSPVHRQSFAPVRAALDN